ncbi:MAG: tRNA (adenosine(37)-N6)-dimethylallyltransferase MiaA [Alphaproteobacteria bacterium]|nr:tRNA (adenosine(37)-N6)-dimethylallyltransferase MiaA [Alphaproteobacteria bacterium]
MPKTKPKISVFLIGGPTASGKSALALQLARRFPATIINGDSMQVYKELPILTSQPSLEEQDTVPHKLYGQLIGDDVCSVGRWQTFALKEIESCSQENRVPIIVGGSGLYLRSLTQGLSEIPPIDPLIRAEARELYQELGGIKFHRQLQTYDPVMASRLHATDQQRLVRAFEVIKSTKISLAIWQEKRETQAISHLDCQIIVLEPPRELVKQQANLRLRTMLKRGAIEEVSILETLKYNSQLPVMKALGVPELRNYLAGRLSLEEATYQIETHTHQYIKRQSTWFRNQFQKQALYINSYDDSTHLIDPMFKIKS